MTKVGRELGVKYVLEGSVRRASDKVRINAQLIDARSGGHIWAERYDGSLADVFRLQDKVSEKIVEALSINLGAVERAALTRPDTTSAEAHDAFLKGWQYYVKTTAEDFKKAIPLFERAIELDPNYGRAHAALASLYHFSWVRRFQIALGADLGGITRVSLRLKADSHIKKGTCPADCTGT